MVIKGVVEYDGTDFYGWQIQKDKRTVQGELIKAFSQILNTSDFKLHGASRTDAGVHAENQVFSLHLNGELEMDLENLRRAVNSVLPRDIYIKSLEDAPSHFHARYQAKSKRYRYRIIDGKRSPLRFRYVWEIPYHLDINALQGCAEELRGEKDFHFLKMTHEKVTQRVRFFDAVWLRKDDELIFEVEGDRFLYKLVRALVGAMVFSVKRFGDKSFFVSFLKGEEDKVFMAPAKGLTLVEVKY